MAINQIGRISFSTLDRYTWQAANFETFQEYLEAYFKEIGTAGWGSGIIYGGVISVSSGLTVAVSKLLALFSGAQFVTFDAATIALSAADVTNPRIDRIELGFALTANTTVNNVDGVPVTFDDKYLATLYVNKGTAAGSPTAPAITAGRLSLGLISVAANQTILVAANFDQSETARDFARKVDSSENSFSLVNNQSSFVAVQNLKLNKLITTKATIEGYVYLATASTDVLYDVTLKARYKAVAAAWYLDVILGGQDVGVVEGMDFSIDSTGQINYKTPNVSGSGFSGTFKWRVSSYT